MNRYFSIAKGFVIERRALLVAAVLILLFAGWFFLLRGGGTAPETLVVHPADFIEQVSVSGTVIAAQNVDLGFAQSGRIAGIYARVGDRVGAGATLATIENGELRAAVAQKRASLAVEQAQLDALKAGTRPEEIAVAESTVINNRLALLNSTRDAYRASDDAVHNKIDQFLSNPRTNPQITFNVSDSSVKTAVENGRSAIEGMLAEWQRDVAALMAEDDLFSAAVRASARFAVVTALLSDSNAALNRAIVTQSVSQTTIDGYITAVGTARSNVNTALSSLTTASAALDAALKNLALKQAGSTSEGIAAQEAQIKVAEADLASAEAGLAKTIVSAPFSGTVTKMDAKVGEIVSPGTSEIAMISNGVFQIESYVPEINIAHVKKGDRAVVTLDAYGESVPFEASVVSVDPAETVRDGVSTYRAILQFAQKDERVRSGMTANVRITTQKKSNVISIPQGAVIERRGATYVTVLLSDGTEERQVTTGDISALGNIEIRSGLKEGDTVVLEPISKYYE